MKFSIVNGEGKSKQIMSQGGKNIFKMTFQCKPALYVLLVATCWLVAALMVAADHNRNQHGGSHQRRDQEIDTNIRHDENQHHGHLHQSSPQFGHNHHAHHVPNHRPEQHNHNHNHGRKRRAATSGDMAPLEAGSRAEIGSYVEYMNQELRRFARQITEFLPPIGQQPPPPPQQSGISGFFSNLGPQIERAKAVQTLFSPPSTQISPLSPTSNGFPNLMGGGSATNPAELMTQLTSLIRSTQERSAKVGNEVAQNVQQGAQQVGTQTVQAAQSAQGGIQSALSEIGAGLQRIAANNPTLLPDVKNLYQSVSSKLSSAQTSVAQATNPQPSSSITPAKNADELVDNLAKVATSG